MVAQMSLWVAALRGFMGAAAIEAWDLYGAIHRVKGFPWKVPGEVDLAPYLVFRPAASPPWHRHGDRICCS